MAGKLFDGAVGAVSNIAGAARHLAWYLSYCIDGSQARPVERSRGEGRRAGSASRRAS